MAPFQKILAYPYPQQTHVKDARDFALDTQKSGSPQSSHVFLANY